MGSAADAKILHFVDSVTPTTTAYQVAEKLNDTRAPAIAITEDRRIVGIISQNEIIEHIVLKGRNPRTTYASDIMFRPQVYVRETVPLSELLWLMRQKGLDHLPITNKLGHFLKLLTITDVLVRRTLELEVDCRDLENMIVADARGG